MAGIFEFDLIRIPPFWTVGLKYHKIIYYILREINLNSKSKSITLLPQHGEVTPSLMDRITTIYRRELLLQT